MKINGNTHKLQAFMEGAHTTTAPSYWVSWVELETVSLITADASGGVLNGATEVDICTGVINRQLKIDTIDLVNVDTVQHTVTFVMDVSGTNRTIYKAILGVGESCHYAEGKWYCSTASGDERVTSAAATSLDISVDTSPQLGGNLDMNGKSIDFGAILTVDGTYKGDIMTVTVDTNGVGFGAVLANAADFNFDEADADAIANCYMLAMAVETGIGSKKVLTKGQICKTSWNWSVGPVMLSVTQGTLTQTAVSGNDDVDLVVGWALSADTIFFNPYAGYAIYKT